MHTHFDAINQIALTTLLKENPAQRVQAVGVRNGWYLVIRRDAGVLALVEADASPRLFPSLDSIDCYLNDLGILNFLVDVSELNDVMEDAATEERRREAAKFSEYDAWFCQQVQASLEDSSPTIPASVVEEQFAARRATLLAKLAKA